MEGNTCHKRTYCHDSCIYYLIQIVHRFYDETLSLEVWTKWENVSSRVRTVVHHPLSGSSRSPMVHLVWQPFAFLGAFGVVHHLNLWNVWHIAIRSLMGAWLFKTPVGPQAHYLNPLQFYTIKKEKAELGSAVHEAKPCGTGKYSTGSQ